MGSSRGNTNNTHFYADTYIAMVTSQAATHLSMMVMVTSVDVAALTVSLYLTFPLKKRHDGSGALDVSSAHWHRPADSQLPSFKDICLLHVQGENGLKSKPRCQITIFSKSKPSFNAILSINVLLPGWCGSSIVGNDVSPALLTRVRCFKLDSMCLTKQISVLIKENVKKQTNFIKFAVYFY